MFQKHYYIDTNIILENASNIVRLSQNSQNLIIISEVVLDEIDAKKSGFEEINFQAREFARMLEGSIVLEKINFKDIHIIALVLNIHGVNIQIHIASKIKYGVADTKISPNILNDRKILELAQEIKSHYASKITFLTLDIMARFRAISLGITADSLLGDNKEFSANFLKEIWIDFESLEKLPEQNITEIDSEHKPYNFSYMVRIKNTDHVILACVKNQKIYFLDENELRNQSVVPLNKEQLFFSHALLDPFYNIVIVDAIAGSGKTLLALSNAIKLSRQKIYTKIIYIRNSIESLDKGEDVGYLPGLEEKFRIYNHPLMDSLDFIVRNEYKKRRSQKNQSIDELDDFEVTQRIDEIIRSYKIETMWVGEMRGRTLSNAFVIIDEAQNMSNKTMQMVLSRIDHSCKAIILGSNKQIDNFYVNKYTNSLTTLLGATKDQQEVVNLFAIRLNKVLRGKITQWAEALFDNAK